MSSNNIVTVDVSQQLASAPITLQRTGAFVSQGGTTLTAGSISLLTEEADLVALLRASIAVSAIAWASSVVTVTTAAAHGIPAGDTVQGTIAGASPSAYDGTFPCTYVSSTSFTYPLASNPGSESTLGTFTLGAVSELSAMGTTFFAQGDNQSVYVLELGPGTPAQGVTALAAYLLNPSPKTFYSYLIPKEWDTETSAPTLFRQYDATTAKTYFFVSTTASTYSAWTTIPTKAVFLVIPEPTAPASEFSAAAMFYVTLAANPGPVNLVAPLALRFLSGVTPLVITPPNFTTFRAAGLNWVGTGAEGGISALLIVNGQMGDLKPWNYWYSVDWMITQSQQALAAAVINGANNPTNPLYYNQQGINTLQRVEQSVVSNGVAFGLVLGSPKPTVTAVDFLTYVAENPDDYAAGEYAGLALTFTPARGFTNITLQLVVTDVVTG